MPRGRCRPVATHATSFPAYPPSAQMSCSPAKRAPSAPAPPGADRGHRRRCGACGRVCASRRHSLGAPCCGGLHRLAVEDPCTRLTRAARGLAQVPTERVVPPLPDTRTAPGPAIRGDGLVRRKGCGAHPPWAPAPQVGEDGMDHLAPVGRARAATQLGRGHVRRQDHPCCVSAIRRRALHHPVPSTPQVLRGPILPRRPLCRQALRFLTSLRCSGPSGGWASAPSSRYVSSLQTSKAKRAQLSGARAQSSPGSCEHLSPMSRTT